MIHGGSWEQAFLVWLTSGQDTAWNALAGLFTFMGTESFFLIVIPAVYWAVSRKTGIRLFYVLMATLFVNLLLKNGLGVARPVGAESVHSRDLESAMVDSHYPRDSFPSAHAQTSAALFGFMALAARRQWAWWTAAALTILVALSRLYNGLHWPTDVLGGIALGALTAAAARYAAPLLENSPAAVRAAALVAFAALMAAAVDGGVGMKLSGALLGGGIGHLLLEARAIVFDPQGGKLWRKALAVAIGLAGMLALKAGLKAALPSGAIWEWLRYALIGFWAFGIAPIVFVRTRLYPQSGGPAATDSAAPPTPSIG